jgi:hypothetical protein
VKTSRLLFHSFFPSFFLVLAFISSSFASLFHPPNPSLSSLTIFFWLLLYEPASPYFPTLHERRGLIHGPLFDMAHSAVSWL